MSSLSEKVALVIGAAGGIGSSVASLLAQHGARVVVADDGVTREGQDPDPNRAAEVARRINEAGGVAVAAHESVASAAGARALVETAVREFGGLDVSINCAGIVRDRPLLRMTDDEFERVLDVQLRGTFYAMRAAAEVMKGSGRGGCIVNTTSRAGLLGNYGQANVSAADAGVCGLTFTASVELQRYGIRVNAVAPVAKTRLTEDLPMFEHVDSMRPEHVAACYVFLASDLSRQTTGSVLSAAGSRLSTLRVVESAGFFKDDGDGIWTPEEIAEHFASIRKI